MRRIAAAATLACALNLQPASADEFGEANFYAGRTISIYVGLPPGGTFDTYARLVAGHLSKHVPGAPAVVVQNMPGAGSIRAANFVYNVAPQDGTAVGAMSSNVPMQPLVDGKGVQYDLKKVKWLPTPARSVNTLVVWHTSPIKTFGDLRRREALLGTLAPGSSPTTAIGVYKHVLGAKAKAVLGYEGLPAVMLAMERGEVDGYSTIPIDTLRRAYGDLWKSGKLRVLAHSGDARLPELPEVPTMLELAQTEEDRNLISLATFTTRMTLPYMMGPNVPEARVDVIRAAMMAMFADAAFKQDAESRQLPIDPVSSDGVARIVRDAYATPAAIVQRLKEIVASQGK